MVELIFLHLPKTGGSSVLKTLEQAYGKKAVRHFERDECIQLEKSNQKIAQVIGPEIKVIHGHIRYVEIKDLVKKERPKLVTFMRNPVDRVVSNFNWFKHTINSKPNHPEKHRINEPLEQYISRPETRNKMTYFLKGIRLKKFYFIGFLESFEEDISILGDRLNWKNASLFHEKNALSYNKSPKPPLEPDLHKKIKRLNKRDQLLFNKASAIWKS